MATCFRMLVTTSVNNIFRRSPASQFSVSARLSKLRPHVRKPRWVPISKSKEFYVRKPTPIIPEEYIELKQRYRLYRAEVESIREFLRKSLSNQEVSLTEQQITQNTEDIDVMEEQVRKWNNTVLVQRNERQAQEELMEEQRLHMFLQNHEEDIKLKANEAKTMLLRNKAASTDFIQPDQLDDAIEKLLDSRSDYNYAVTKAGDILPGEFLDKLNSPSSKRS